MDNVKGMKLYKSAGSSKRRFYKEYSMTFPPREFVLEMNEINIENRDEILGYFKKYKDREASIVILKTREVRATYIRSLIVLAFILKFPTGFPAYYV
jgi:hypothetical protein